MEFNAYLQIKNIEDELMHCQEENERLQMIIDLQKVQKELKERVYDDQGKRMEYLYAYIEELWNEKHLNKKYQNPNMKRETDV